MFQRPQHGIEVLLVLRDPELNFLCFLPLPVLGILLLLTAKGFCVEDLKQYHQRGRVTKNPHCQSNCFIVLANFDPLYVRSQIPTELGCNTQPCLRPSASGAPPRKHFQAWLPPVAPGAYKYHPVPFGSFIASLVCLFLNNSRRQYGKIMRLHAPLTYDSNIPHCSATT